MNISKETLKYYGIPALAGVILILIVFLVPLKKQIQPAKDSGPSAPPQEVILPTKIFLSSTPGPSPTLLPPQDFTGAEAVQEIPPEERSHGIEKTSLRRQTPITLPFGVIRFDYENDRFTVHLSAPDQKDAFEVWRRETHPSLPQEEFAIQ